MNPALNRRNVLTLMAGTPLLVAGNGAAVASAAVIERLIRESQTYPRISQRIDFISSKLLGARYRANTLVGGPILPE